MSRLCNSSSPTLHRTDFEYDPSNRLTKIIAPATENGQSRPKTVYAYRARDGTLIRTVTDTQVTAWPTSPPSGAIVGRNKSQRDAVTAQHAGIGIISCHPRFAYGLNMAFGQGCSLLFKFQGRYPWLCCTWPLDKKTPGALPSQGLCCIWPLAMGLFAKGDGQDSQGQRPWRNAQRTVFANGDSQPINALVILRSLFVPLSKPYTFCESKRRDAEIAEAED
jgi:hypothetical protein